MNRQASLAFDETGSSGTKPERLTAWNPALWTIDPSWAPVVQGFLASPTGQKLSQFIAQRLADGLFAAVRRFCGVGG